MAHLALCFKARQVILQLHECLNLYQIPLWMWQDPPCNLAMRRRSSLRIRRIFLRPGCSAAISARHPGQLAPWTRVRCESCFEGAALAPDIYLPERRGEMPRRNAASPILWQTLKSDRASTSVHSVIQTFL